MGELAWVSSGGFLFGGHVIDDSRAKQAAQKLFQPHQPYKFVRQSGHPPCTLACGAVQAVELQAKGA